MVADIHVRGAVETDIAAITAIYRPEVLHGTATFELDPPDEAEMARRLTSIVQGGYPFLVADIDGVVFGYAYASSYRARPAYRFAVENSIYVAASARGEGVGRALMAELIAQCERRGFRQMIAVIGDSANAGSIGLHRAMGFIFSGVLHSVGYKHGRWLDSVQMQRALGQGDGSAPTT